MKQLAFRHLLVGVVVGGAIAACAQIEGLGDYQKVDCLDDCPDAATPVPPPTPPPVSPIDSGNDAATCPTCSGSTPICDPGSLKCVECLPGKLDCAAGYFCDPDPKLGYHCVLGCGVVDDCIKVLSMDAGADAKADAGGDGGLFSTYACCNNRCVDTAASDANCGMCGHACGVGAACCASTCTDITSNATSCGGCGNVCSNNNIATPTCTLGRCSGMCNTGFDDCNNDKLTDGCESDIYNDPNKCGACNHSCSTNHVLAVSCSVGTCDGACDSANGWADCNNNKLVDGCEANITNDANHCGACPNLCSNNNMATRTCATSVCNGNCNAGYADCNANKLADGCEVNTTNDANNCGGCNNVCSNNNIATPTCAGSACNGTCGAGFADCDNNKLTNGCETNTQTDPNHCGACLAKVCSNNHISTPTCAAGTCNGTCDPGWGDCDNNKLANGCEAKTDEDTLHCGAACTACAAGNRNCVGGTCSPGYGQTYPAIAFVDACAQAGAVRVLTDTDDGTATLTLPATFDFKYYGTTITTAWASSNGVLGLGATTSSQYTFTCTPPIASDPVASIFPYARDLYTRGPASNPPVAGGICYATTGAAPNRRFVVTWSDTSICCDSSAAGPHLTFSVVLEETTYRADILYQTLTAGDGYTPDGNDALIGLQGDPASQPATTFTCGGTPALSRISAGMAIQFIP